MLEKVDLTQKLNKKEYKSQIKELNNMLNSLQQKMRVLGIPVCIVFEGWSASGKGTLMSKILYPLDPRYVNVYTMNRLSEESLMRPILWSYWEKMPSKGRMSIFDKSWHRAALPDGREKWNMTDKEAEGLYYDINSFEKAHLDDGTLIIKLFLHISKKEQEKRLRALKENENSAWRVGENNLKQNDNYKDYLVLFEDMIQQTNTLESQWTVIEADDKRYATVKILKTIINKISEEIVRKESENLPSEKALEEIITPPEVSILSGIEPQKTITDEEYKEKLKVLQKKAKDLEYKLYMKRRSVTMVFEGWDAAGKGGSIKRITEEMDPRGYEVVPVAAPSSEELSHNYLWRFYRKMPKDGHIAIFDRSWYGRVMVERIEKLAKENEWKRAYREINDMELHLHNHGTVIFKFWLQIDKEEQLRRFQARQADPLKQYKITDEDWRNREKWDQYEEAVNEMLLKTDTEYAPWLVVEANQKKFARIKILEHFVKTLEKKLSE